MGELTDKIVVFIIETIISLFGHAGAISAVITAIIALVSIIIYFLVLSFSIYFTKKYYRIKFVRYFSKSVLIIQAFIAASFLGGFVSIFFESAYQINSKYTMVIPQVICFLLLCLLVYRLGYQKTPNKQINRTEKRRR